MRRRRDRQGEPDAPFQPHDLAGLFAPPRWLRDLGTSAWLAVGITLLLVGAVWILSLTTAIVLPLITAAVVAAVASPVVAWLERHRVARGLGSALVLLGVALVAAGAVVAVLGGIASETDGLRALLARAQDTLQRWLTDAGVDPGTAERARDDTSSAVQGGVSTLLDGIAQGIASLSSLAIFLALTALSLFFLLKDGRTIRTWTERHMRVPEPVAHRMTQRVLESLRGYFAGVTFVAAFNAVLAAVGAIVLGVPLPGTLAAVTFLGAYVPYLGAWGAGIFSVLIALGGAGTDAAIGMAVVQLLANGLLQQLVQPVAYGAALGIHPLAVLVVTIAGGSLFGAVGLILAAPLTAAATHIAADLARERPAETLSRPGEAPGAS